MFSTVVFVAAVLGASPALADRPDAAAMVEARAQLREVFGKQADAATTPAARGKLADELLPTAAAERNPAAKFALLVKARDLYIDAGQISGALRATKAIAEAFVPPETIKPEDFLNRGNKCWKEAEELRGGQLIARLEAAEWYYRALPDASGLSKALIDKHLAEIVGSPTGAVTPKRGERWISKTASYRPSSQHENFTPLAGLLTGEETTGKLYKQDFAFHTATEKSPSVVIDLGKPYQLTRVVIDNRRDVPDRADGLQLWLGLDKNRGRKVWQAKQVEQRWEIPLHAVKARYVTLAITNKTPTPLHLAHVWVFGE